MLMAILPLIINCHLYQKGLKNMLFVDNIVIVLVINNKLFNFNNLNDNHSNGYRNNVYRNNINLSNVNLSNNNLSNVNLSNINLNNVNLNISHHSNLNNHSNNHNNRFIVFKIINLFVEMLMSMLL